jgi:hypothetical protein
VATVRGEFGARVKRRGPVGFSKGSRATPQRLHAVSDQTDCERAEHRSGHRHLKGDREYCIAAQECAENHDVFVRFTS